MKEPTETDICKSFIRQVRMLEALKQFDREFIIMHVANESRSGNKLQAIIFTKQLMAMGMLPGAPDYIIIYAPGKVAAIEFKRNKSSKLSENQKEFKRRCDLMGVPYLCTFDKEIAITWMMQLLSLCA